MQNNKIKLIKEINDLKQEFNNNQDIYINYYHKIYEARNFVHHYDNLLQQKEKYQTTKKFVYIILVIILISNLYFTYYALNINPSELAQLLSGGLLAFSAGASSFIVGEVIKNNKKLKNLQYELNENSARYEELKNNIPVYNKEREKLANYLSYDLLPRIEAKHLEYDKLTNQENTKPLLENVYPNPFINEITNHSKDEQQKKTLVRIKR